MVSKFRTILIAILSLFAVFFLFRIYTQLTDTSVITEDETERMSKISDSNESVLQKEFGRVGDVGVKTAEMALFTTYRDKKLVREWGFAQLLHEEGKQWQIEKPYMNMYRSDATISMTADQGFVTVEQISGKPVPKDAKLSGNIVIHLEPLENDGDGLGESFIYLDDVTYIEEESLYTTEGSIRFISSDIRIEGKGMEIVYDEVLERISYFAVEHLDRLSLRRPKEVSMIDPEQTEKKPTTKTEPAAVAVPELKTESTQVMTATPKPQESEDEPQEAAQGPFLYRCVLFDNVMINGPDHLVFAPDVLNINNVLFANTEHEEQPEKEKTKVVKTNETEILDADQKPVVTVEYVDIVVTCDGAIVILPMEASVKDHHRPRPDREQKTPPKDFNQVAGSKKYTFSAPQIDVEMSGDIEKNLDVDYVDAEGDVVQLATIKQTPDGIGGFVKLRCKRFEYDRSQKTCKAHHGMVVCDNSKIQPSEESKGRRFSLQQPCHLFLRDIGLLNYDLEKMYLTAKPISERSLLIDYIPVSEGSQISATTGFLEAYLEEGANSGAELKEVVGKEGITYEELNEGEQDRPSVTFSGSQFHYIFNPGLITASGSQAQPCYLNGLLVNSINYNIETGKLRFEEIVGGDIASK